MPFIEAIPVGRRPREVKVGMPAEPVLIFEVSQGQKILKRSWFSPDLDRFPSKLPRPHGYGRGEMPPILRNSTSCVLTSSRTARDEPVLPKVAMARRRNKDCPPIPAGQGGARYGILAHSAQRFAIGVARTNLPTLFKRRCG